MDVIVCVDDRMGLSFNGRRQSKDQVLRAWIADHLQGGMLCMNAYSAKQFSDFPQDRLMVREDFLENAGENDCCFAETSDLLPWEDRIRRLILCRWNRHYPSDRKLDLDLSHWTLKESQEFPGSSHERITVEVYEK